MRRAYVHAVIKLSYNLSERDPYFRMGFLLAAEHRFPKIKSNHQGFIPIERGQYPLRRPYGTGR